MTTYKSIQIKSNDINLICKTLIPYKQRFVESLKLIDKKIHKIAPMFKLNYDNLMMLLYDAPMLNFTVLLAHDGILSIDLTSDLSEKINVPCVYAEFFDDEYYRVFIYDKGKPQASIIRKNSPELSVAEEPDIERCCNILELNNKQRSELLRAVNIEDLDESFFALEYAFGALLNIDYNHLDNRMIKEFEDLNVKYCYL